MPISPADALNGRPTLVLEGVTAGYEDSLVVRGVSAEVASGEIATVVGPNGSGKSTLLKAITGGIPVRQGKVLLGGERVTNLRRDILVRRGIGYVPQENEVIKSLSVRDNLELGGHLLPRQEVAGDMERVIAIFPRLAGMQKSPAGHLSGGERKMLAMGRILMLRPRVVILDEPSASLSPAASAALLGDTVPALSAAGAAVLLVEQRALQALSVSTWAFLMVAGVLQLQGRASEIAARSDIGELFLGAGAADADEKAVAWADLA